MPNIIVIKLMMKNKKLLYGILVAIVAIAGIGLFVYLSEPAAPLPEGKIIVNSGSGMMMADCDNKSYITEKADYIIEGTIEKVESKWDAERTSIFTYADMRIENYAKGTPFTEDKLQIVAPGGTVLGITEGVEGSPIFHEGEKVRIYFGQVNGEFLIVCAEIGVEEI